MKKVLASVLALTMAASLVGCGSSSTADTTAAEAQTEASSAAEAAEDGTEAQSGEEAAEGGEEVSYDFKIGVVTRPDPAG